MATVAKPAAPVLPAEYDRTFWSPITSWLTTTDHKLIAQMYMFTGFMSFIVAGIFALLMRVQLSVPNNTFIGDHEIYNQLMSAHGTTMIFFFTIPMMTGVMNYFVPLMVGARDIAFPRVNALGYWLIPVSIFIYYAGFFIPNNFASGDPSLANAGWTGYPPLSDLKYNGSVGIDLWCVSITILGLSSIMAAVNFLTTILALRAPGMKLTRLPLFVWASISTSILLLIATPSLAAGLILLLIDREFHTNFFTTAGRPVLFQHLFWFYSHPAVYIMILPGFGVISEVIPVFSRKAIFGYESMVLALFGIVFLSLGVWAHHMFTVGLNIYVETLFMALTMAIAVPTGVKFFNWMGTAWDGAIEFKTPMKFAFGFLATFLIGGITGIYLAAVPVDTQLHQSYYVVAHLHYVLFGGSVFTIFAGLYYWLPKITGRILNERLGNWNFWTLFVGFNGTFLVMHTLGLDGMPRRIATYARQDWAATNFVITVSAFLIAASVLIFVINVLYSRKRGELAGPDPWDGNSLEWSVSSPPPPYNFERIPEVHSREPWKDMKLADRTAPPATPAPAPAH